MRMYRFSAGYLASCDSLRKILFEQVTNPIIIPIDSIFRIKNSTEFSFVLPTGIEAEFGSGSSLNML